MSRSGRSRLPRSRSTVSVNIAVSSGVGSRSTASHQEEPDSPTSLSDVGP